MELYLNEADQYTFSVTSITQHSISLTLQTSVPMGRCNESKGKVRKKPKLMSVA